MLEKAILPLFPLEVVLLPNAVLPLHIFEPRYRRMIGNAIEAETEFGVVQINDGTLATVGCGARIQKVVNRFDDGRLDIETRGTMRFRTLSLDQSEEVVQGVVEYFEDDSPAQANLSQVETLVALANRVAKLVRRVPPEPFEVNHPLLSFQVASGLPVDLKIKQTLLESTSEIERVGLLSGYLEGVLDQAETRRSRQRLAGTNGHAKLH